jgi:hypothetical protein
MVAVADAGPTGDAAPRVAIADDQPATGSGAGSGSGTGSAGSGAPGGLALASGSGTGSAGAEDQPAVDGAPTTAGTAANLLAYLPAGHILTVLVRFDRLRGTEWATAAEGLFRPMPDYQALFGARTANLSDKIDTLVISTPRPRDATATTLVVHTALARPALRTLLDQPGSPIAWSTVKGGVLGHRGGRAVLPGDTRMILSPFRGWFVLAQPSDLGGLLAPATGNLDKLEASGKLPPWLARVREIEAESGATRGPALVLTMATPTLRYKLPDVGLGVTTLPGPERVSLAMEAVKQGWLLRGNIVFRSEADAGEFVQAITDAQQRVADSHLLSAVLRRGHALNAVTGLSLTRTGARVSYATSLSIADARAVMIAAAANLDDYFGRGR